MSISTKHDGALTVDGYIDVELENQDIVTITKSEHTAQFIRLGSRSYFYETLIQRLNRRNTHLNTS